MKPLRNVQTMRGHVQMMSVLRGEGQEVLIRSKNGIGDGLQPVPPEQEGGKKKKPKVFHSRE